MKCLRWSLAAYLVSSSILFGLTFRAATAQSNIGTNAPKLQVKLREVLPNEENEGNECPRSRMWQIRCRPFQVILKNVGSSTVTLRYQLCPGPWVDFHMRESPPPLSEMQPMVEQCSLNGPVNLDLKPGEEKEAPWYFNAFRNFADVPDGIYHVFATWHLNGRCFIDPQKVTLSGTHSLGGQENHAQSKCNDEVVTSNDIEVIQSHPRMRVKP